MKDCVICRRSLVWNKPGVFCTIFKKQIKNIERAKMCCDYREMW